MVIVYEGTLSFLFLGVTYLLCCIHILHPTSLLSEARTATIDPLCTTWIPELSGSLNNIIDSNSYYYLLNQAQGLREAGELAHSHGGRACLSDHNIGALNVRKGGVDTSIHSLWPMT